MVDTVQVIDGSGNFHEQELAEFINNGSVAEARTNYQVVAIMGPQSSGKSTLMNHLFATTFTEMDAMSGRQQTTRGVWMARCPKIDDPTTLVMDLEGTDGRERGEDDTNFERQVALFALAVADVLLVNIWCHDIGREQASGKPLMKTIFQVNLKLFAPEPNRRKTVLLFVIRDKSKTPLKRLTEILQEDLDRMWDTISKPPQYTNSKIHDFFEVQFAALPHFEEKYEDFKADSVVLRRRFSSEEAGPDGLVRAAPDKLPAGALALSTANIWSVIRSQKDLNLPAHKIMVASIRCNEIKNDQLSHFTGDQAWEVLQQEASTALVPDFGKRVHSLLDSCLQGYDAEAAYFDSHQRDEHRSDLVTKLHSAIAAPLATQLSLLSAACAEGWERDLKVALSDAKGSSAAAGAAASARGNAAGDEQGKEGGAAPKGFSAAAAAARAAALARFDERSVALLVEGTPLTAADAREALAAQIDARIAALKHTRIKEATQAAEKALATAITLPAVELLQTCPNNLWPRLHAAKRKAVAAGEKVLGEQLAGVDLEAAEQSALAAKLEAAADGKLRSHLQEAALTRSSRMRDAFHEAFAVDEHGTPRTWRPRDNIPALAKAGRLKAAGVLAQLLVVRGPDYSAPDAPARALLAMAQADLDERSARGAGGSASSSSSSQAEAGDGGSGAESGAQEDVFELADASDWPGVAAEDVLVTPHEARAAWREMVSQSALSVQQAQVTQQANLAAGNRSPPVWALAAMLFLGWNELVTVLWNPLYLVGGLLLFLFLWQLYKELDVDGEMQKGALPGSLSIAAKLWPTLKSVSQRSIDQVTHMAAGGGHALLEEAQKRLESPSKRNTHPSQHQEQEQQQQRHASADGLTRRKQGEQAGVQMTSLNGGSPARVAAAAQDGVKEE